MRRFVRLRKNASAGVDDVTYAEYEQQARERIELLHEKLKSKTLPGAAAAQESISRRRTGARDRSRFPALEDKIVQRATVELLEAIFEQDFLPCSYGFRPGRRRPTSTGRGRPDDLPGTDRICSEAGHRLLL